MLKQPEQKERHVLYVDTEPLSFSGVHHLLRCEGVLVTTCSSLEGAVTALEQRDYSLVLIGRGMSGSDDGLRLGFYARERRPGTEVVLAGSGVTDTIRRSHDLDFLRCSLTLDGIQDLYLKIINKESLSAPRGA